jgi:3-isopropylmalate/(R)-2-methylmalate dehydratase small subunit
MKKFTTLTSRVVPLVVDNVDTDQIIPARFLKTTDKTGLGAALFCDWRYQDEVPDLEAAGRATARIDFALNDPRYEGAQILLTGDNFGCGSSREHAPWALVDWGFRAVISTSFADIFRSNALKNSLLPVEVDLATHAELAQFAAAGAGITLTINLPSQILRLPDGRSVEFPIEAFARRCLIEGVDQLGYLLSFANQIADHEERPR